MRVSRPTPSCTVADGEPEWALLVCGVPGGARTYAQIRDADACARAEHQELIGREVKLTPTEADGPMGTVTKNVATL